MMPRRILSVGLCCLLLVSGCWNRREIETLGFALATAIDWDEESQQYEVTVQMAKPEVLAKAPGSGEGGLPYWVFTGRAKTVFGAVRNITMTSPRKVWWGHNQVLILGDSVARRGIRSALDFVARDGETRRLFWVLVTPGKAGDILTRETRSAKAGALALLDLIRVKGATSVSAPLRMHDFSIMLSAPMATTTGVVRLAARGDVAGTSADYRLEGAAVFIGDKLVHYLDSTETRGMLWVQGKVRSGILHVPCPGDPQESVALEIVHAASRIEPLLKNGRLAISVTIREQANLGDTSCRVPLDTPADFERLEQAQQAAIRSEINAALSKARNLRADVFGFGQKVHKDMPKVWHSVDKDWERKLATIPVDIRVTAKVRRLGLQPTPAPVR
jgi:spore germination protein KC